MKNKIKKEAIILSLTVVLGIISATIALIVFLSSKSKLKSQDDSNDKKETADEVIISFVTDGGSSINNITTNKGGKIELPATVKDGFILSGWYLDNAIVDNSYEYNESVTLIAKWIEITDDMTLQKISFNTNGGSRVKNIIMECGSVFLLPQAPVRDGYTFVNWSKKDGKVVSSEDILTCEDITLYANWKKVDNTKVQQ